MDDPAAAMVMGGVPIVVGVTGHRDAHGACRRAVETRTARVLDELRRTAPATPLVFVTALAEHVDRWAARAALRHARREPHAVRVAVCLPLPIDACTADFGDLAPAGVDRDRRRNRSAAWVRGFLARLEHERLGSCATLAQDPNATPARLVADPSARRDAYVRLALHLARSVHVLIAGWNGESADPAHPGGTVDVIRWFMAECPPRAVDPDRNPLDEPGGLRVEFVPVSRATGRTPSAGGARTGTDRDAADDELRRAATRIEGFARSEFRHLRLTGHAADAGGGLSAETAAAGPAFARIHAFNADVARHPELEASARHAAAALLPSDASASPAGRAMAGHLRAFGYADVLSQHVHQRATRATRARFLVLTALAVVSFELYAHLTGNPVWYVIHLAILGLAFTLLAFAKHGRIEEKFLEYRCLAEALRVQVYFRLCGLQRSAADRYDQLHLGEVDWVRQALKGLEGGMPPRILEPLTRADAVDRIHWTMRGWIGHQQRWLHAKTHANHEGHQHVEAAVRFLLPAGFVVALVLLSYFLCPRQPNGHGLEHGLLVASVLLFAAAGLVHEYGRQRGFRMHLARYEALFALFDRAQRRLEAADARLRETAGAEPEFIRESLDIISELGRESLTENMLWLLLQRDRPLEVHVH